MPFTLAHPAIVLPLRRTGLVFSALIVGSLTPDFPYFLQIANEIRWGHTSRGVFLFCLPVGLAVLWLFHAAIKRPLVALAPEFMRTRIAERDLDFRFGPVPRFALIIVSLLLGSISHVLWDGFTHENGYFVKHWEWLSMLVTTYREMPLWRALQHGCSVLGVAVVAVVALWWWYRKPVVAEPVHSEMTPRLRWFVVGIMALLASMVGLAAGLNAYHGHGWKLPLVKSVIAFISSGGAEILLYSLVWQWSRKNEKPLDREAQRLEVTTER